MRYIITHIVLFLYLQGYIFKVFGLVSCKYCPRRKQNIVKLIRPKHIKRTLEDDIYSVEGVIGVSSTFFIELALDFIEEVNGMKFAKLRSGFELRLGDVRNLDNLQRVLEDLDEDDIFDILMIFQYQAIRVRRKRNFDYQLYDWWLKRLAESKRKLTESRFIDLKIQLGIQSVDQQLKFGRKMITYFLWKD